MKPGRYAPARGFTLIEVLIALLVVALGIGSLLTTIASSADNVGHLRDKSFAEWVALNRISEVRLATARPAPGTSTGETEFAGVKWRWRQVVADQGMAGMLRIDVSVARAESSTADNAARQPAATDPASPTADSFNSLTTAYGFLGTAVAPGSGIDPDWSITAAGTGNPP